LCVGSRRYGSRQIRNLHRQLADIGQARGPGR